MNKLMKLFVAICSVVIISSFSGAFALWTYYDNASPLYSEQNMNLEEFYYAENVPDDGEHELSHNALLEKIVDFNYGLNNYNSLLSKAVRERFGDGYDRVSSNQQVSGGNLKNVFSNIDGFENVGFLIYYVNDEEYYVYTYDNRETTKIGSTIETYLTHLHLREGKWILSGGFEGSATVCSYNGNTSGKYKNTIDPSTFVRK